MSQTNLNVRMDADLKNRFDKLCSDIGMNMTTAVNIFASAAVRQQRIPFELSADPFYAESNMKYLKKVISDIETGRAKLAEHDLIED